MNAIHQISLKLRLGIDTHADIQPEVLLEKWQDHINRRLRSTQPTSSGTSEATLFKASGNKPIRRN